jgi:carboxymethylenebutenolidase
VCFDDDSIPPAPPDAGKVERHGPLELEATDGNRFAAYEAVPETPRGANMVILPDRRGMHPFYFLLTQRFAEAGYHSVTFDYFGRTAGVDSRKEGFRWGEHGLHLKPDQVRLDAAAAAAHLRAQQPEQPTFAVGFCFGGGHSWRLAASDIGFTGCIGLYGIPAMVYDLADQLSCPIMILVAGADWVAPADAYEALDQRLDELGKDHEMYTYEGAPHAYFDEFFADWGEVCEDSWRRMIAFTDRVGSTLVAN